MTVLCGLSASDLFAAAGTHVLAVGAVSAPRAMPTMETLGVHLHLSEPSRRLVHLPPVRLLNPAFAVAEAMWIISGSDDPWIFDFNRRLSRYADGGVLRGAYGPRLRRWQGSVDQLDQVRHQLLDDPDSRRAVVQLFDPARDHSGHKDVPCTLGFRFFLRDGRLHMHTTMRSQDLWLGFPYDVFTFTLLHELLAGWLGAQVGEYRHSVDSLHLYAEHCDAARALPPHPPGDPMAPMTLLWEDADEVLRRVIAGDAASLTGTPWAGFASVLASYRLWRAGNREDARAMAVDVPGVLGVSLRDWYVHLAPAEAVTS